MLSDEEIDKALSYLERPQPSIEEMFLAAKSDTRPPRPGYCRLMTEEERKELGSLTDAETCALIRQLKDQRDTLAKALRFYAVASEGEYEIDMHEGDICHYGYICADKGNTARQTLLAVGLMEKGE